VREHLLPAAIAQVEGDAGSIFQHRSDSCMRKHILCLCVQERVKAFLSAWCVCVSVCARARVRLFVGVGVGMGVCVEERERERERKREKRERERKRKKARESERKREKESEWGEQSARVCVRACVTTARHF